MTPAEAATVLAVAAALDGRLRPADVADAQARARVWAVTLAATMTPEWAARAVTEHYARSTEVLMPAQLNARWRSHVDRIQSAQRAAELRARTSTPMPPALRAALAGRRG